MVHSDTFSPPWGAYNPSRLLGVRRFVIQLITIACATSRVSISLLGGQRHVQSELSHLPTVTPHVFQPSCFHVGRGINNRYNQEPSCRTHPRLAGARHCLTMPELNQRLWLNQMYVLCTKYHHQSFMVIVYDDSPTIIHGIRWRVIVDDYHE